MESRSLTYTQTVGTVFSETFEKDRKISLGVNEELGVEFWKIFSTKIGISKTTEYNWNSVSSQTKKTIKSTTMQTPIPAGRRNAN